ncbi:hypothetical protein DFJ73DRAFT_900954 [Zopfochytrium polystomum]|nr:hypothetical protein DFJ73DRAFT_900954 [Zopfochytrium polystomum]
MSIAVTGSTGKLGKLVVELLTAKAPSSTVIALARDPSKAPRGVESREFDYRWDVARLASSLTGVRTLVLISTNDFRDRVAQHAAVVDAAAAAGVATVVYTSFLRAPTSEVRIAADHAATERRIVAAGLRHVFLRNGWRLENWTDPVAMGPALAHGGILNAVGGGKVSPATRRDYAEAAVAAALLAHEGGEVREVYELGGETITLDELAAEVTRHAGGGKTVVSAAVPRDVFAKRLEGFGLPAALTELFAQCDDAASRGALCVGKEDLVELIGHEPYSWRLHVEEAVAAALAK